MYRIRPIAVLLAVGLLMFMTVGRVWAFPPLPSSFYGQIQITDGAPVVGDQVLAYVPGVSNSVGSATIQLYGGNLVYAIDVRGDDTDNPPKNGGHENDVISFYINGRLVMTGVWHSGTNVSRNIHPPDANPGAPYTANEGATITLDAGGTTDWGSDIASYEWDLDNDGQYDDATSVTASFSPPDNGVFPIGLRVTDGQGGVSTDSTSVTVNNLAPAVTAQGDETVNEGASTLYALGSFSDAGVNDGPWAVVVMWGDGTPDTHFSMATQGALTSQSHVYADGPNIYTVQVIVTDKDLSYHVGSFQITVNNVAPTATLDSGNTYTWDESATAERTFTFTASDPAGVADPLVMTADCGTGGSLVAGSVTATSFRCIFADGPANPMVSATADDGDSGITTASHTVTVNNVAPTANAGPDQTVDEGQTASFLGSGLDVPADTLTYDWDFNYDGITFDVGATGATVSTSYPDGPTSYTVALRVTDKDGASTIDTLVVTVNDVAPIPEAGGPYNGIAGQPVTLIGTPGCVAVDACTVEWFFGASSIGTNNSVNYTWNTVGDYTVEFRVTDDDGNMISDSAAVHISGATQSINLVPGWNLVSFNLHPVNTDIAQVLASITGTYTLVYAWNGQTQNWQHYDPGGFANSLSTLDETQGFWIYMNVAESLDVVGSVPSTTNISLYSGWNMVGYPAHSDGALPAALDAHSVTGEYPLVYAYHANETADPWKLYDWSAPAWANDLTAMSPLWGYWVSVSGPHIWHVEY
jgi:hypothetical protein